MSLLREKLIEIQADIATAIALLGQEEASLDGASGVITPGLCWGAKVSADFRASVLWIEEQGVVKADWLMACMAFETGLTFSPSVRNPASSATGLIQFMDATAKGLDTTTQALAKLS